MVRNVHTETSMFDIRSARDIDMAIWRSISPRSTTAAEPTTIFPAAPATC